MKYFNQFLSSRSANLWLMLAFEAILIYAFVDGEAPLWKGFGVLAVPPSILAVSLAQTHGSPKNWWAAYFGMIMDVNLKRFEAEYGTRGEVLRAEVSQWIKDSGIKAHYQSNAFRHVFLRKKHALMFKLAWG